MGYLTGMIELPSENVRRWTVRRKAAVLKAVNSGEVTREEICRRYQISVEELLSWQRDYESHGLYGLRSTRLQIYHLSRRGVTGDGSWPSHTYYANSPDKPPASHA